MQVESYTSVHRTDHAVTIPGLRLNEHPVGNHPLIDRVARLRGIDEPVLVIFESILRHKITICISLVTVVGIGSPNILINLAPGVVFERMTDEYGRQIGDRKVAFGNRQQRNTVRLFDKERIVAVSIGGFRRGQFHRHARRHFEGRIPNRPFTHHAAVLTRLDVVVDESGMHRITLSRMRNGDRKVVVLGTGPLVKALGTARPIIDVEAGSRRNIMPQRQAEILLPELLLSRLKVHEVKIRPFEVVEGDVFHAIGIDIEPFGKREVAVLRPFEVVVR